MTGKGRRHLTVEQRAARGAAARAAVPPGEHAELSLPPDRADPIAVLESQAVTRLPELLPVRHGRMVASPFTFYRGTAAIMAADLAESPVSGISVQLCGDAHLSNFGIFASPERHLLFDLNDFDETYPGPWEWDLKRLTASLAIAGRENGFGRKDRRKTVVAAVGRYQAAMTRFATMGEVDVWYAQAEVSEILEVFRGRLSPSRRKKVDKALARARGNDRLKALGKLTTVVDGTPRIKADPPLLVPIADLVPEVARERLESELRDLLGYYRRTLQPDRRLLFDKYDYMDMARKVVGVGSVGTRCWIVLLTGRDGDDPLFLQVKEAQESVLARHVPAAMQPRQSVVNQGKRVVDGQRVMQAASDIFLGWQTVEGIDGVSRDFYVRQLRDQKGSARVDQMPPATMRVYGELCGWTLARAHARSGDAVAIASYLGQDDAFAKALAENAERYADQTERDHAALVAATKAGRLAVEAT